MPIDIDLLDPLRRVYDEQVLAGEIEVDAMQLALVGRLDQLMHDYSTKRLSSKSSSLGWLFGKKVAENPTKDGCYIWGGVGRGKSHIMDMFFSIFNIIPKRRVHFNDFMQEAHQLIHEHRQKFKAGKTKQKDPIPAVGNYLADQSKLLCFDEFAVSDIADAMLLGRLFKVLFDRGTIIVATSNIQPQDLYHNGLNRQLFLPFIELMSSKMSIFELNSTQDYRLSKLPIDTFYSWPLNDEAAQTMQSVWRMLTDGSKPETEIIEMKGRQLVIPQCAKGVARFHFDQLCREPRGVGDYLAIARRYKTVMIDEIPILLDEERNEAKRFILLIDVLYDNRCRLIVSAQGLPQAIYTANGVTEAFEIRRTISRLVEMQSQEYNDIRDVAE